VQKKSKNRRVFFSRYRSQRRVIDALCAPTKNQNSALHEQSKPAAGVSKPGGGNVSDRPGVEPTSSGLHVWGQYHSSEKVSCDEWYWNPSADISGYMCGARGASYAACCSQQGVNPLDTEGGGAAPSETVDGESVRQEKARLT